MSFAYPVYPAYPGSFKVSLPGVPDIAGDVKVAYPTYPGTRVPVTPDVPVHFLARYTRRNRVFEETRPGRSRHTRVNLKARTRHTCQTRQTLHTRLRRMPYSPISDIIYMHISECVDEVSVAWAIGFCSTTTDQRSAFGLSAGHQGTCTRLTAYCRWRQSSPSSMCRDVGAILISMTFVTSVLECCTKPDSWNETQVVTFAYRNTHQN